jgi:hypothetical protein
MIGAPIFRYALTPGWAGDRLARAAQAVPSLDLNFAVTKTVGPLVTFNRASSATYIDSAGTLQTAAVDVPRFDHNPTTGESLGLLVEEQRTNLRLNSATYQPTSVGAPAAYTADQVAPDGTTTGSRQTAASPRTFEDYIGIANALYTFSFYCRVTSGTAAFSIQLKNAGSDTVITSDTSPVATTTWKRFSISGTTNGGTPGARVELVSVVPGFVFWGAQLEAGGFASSYMPAAAAAVTRNADVVSITGANFSSWYRQDEGTTYISAQVGHTVPGSTFPVVAAMSDGTSSNRLEYGYLTATLAGFGVVTGGVDQNSVYPLTTASIRNLAGTYRLNNGAASVNGGAVSVINTMTVPAVNQLTIGRAPFAGNILNGTIRRLTYWPQRLPNSTLVALTQ